MGSKLRKLRQMGAKPIVPEPAKPVDDTAGAELLKKVGPHVTEALERGDDRIMLAYALLWLAHDVASGGGFGAALIPTLTELERIAERERTRS